MEKLSRQPLLEAAFELNWKNMKYPFLDPNYQILIGALYERIRDKFPQFEALPTASIPPEALPPNNRLTQYRFWSPGKTWPVVQVGHGILTINIDKIYEGWDNFRQTITTVIDIFTNTYPDTQNLFIDKLTLRYINGFYYLGSHSNILEFLSKYLHINLNIDFDVDFGKQKKLNPSDINLALTYELHESNTFLNLKTFKGKVNDEEKLLLEILVTSNENKSIENFNIHDWLEKAHKIISSVFKSLIRGELEDELR